VFELANEERYDRIFGFSPFDVKRGIYSASPVLYNGKANAVAWLHPPGHLSYRLSPITGSLWIDYQRPALPAYAKDNKALSFYITSRGSNFI
jgi:hypothetical protein